MHLISSNDNAEDISGLPRNDNVVLFLGMGYTAQYLAHILKLKGWKYIHLPTRENKARNKFVARGFQNLGIPTEGDFSKVKSLIPSSDEVLNFHNIVQVTLPKFGGRIQEFKNSSFYNDPIQEFYSDQIISLASHRKPVIKYQFTDYINAMLDKVTHIIVTAPPQGSQDVALNKYIQLIIEKTPQLKWVGYLSSTSVYGDHKGEIVTENSECLPTTQRGKDRLAVEKLWQALASEYGVPVHIFRLSGIYGHGRSNVDAVRNKEAVSVVKNNHVTNRIYVKDIAQILYVSMNKPTPGEIFNISDDLPASSVTVNDYIAFLLGQAEPEKVAYEQYLDKMSDMKKSFYTENRLISNEKFKKILGISLKFPTFREGIDDILKIEQMYLGKKV